MDVIEKKLSALRSGIKSPLYNPLLSDADRKLKRTYPKYKKWMTTTKQNKNYTCEICLNKDNLHSHHLYSYNKYPEIKCEMWNCAVLCRNCHIKFHKKYGNSHNTFTQFAEFYKENNTKDYENELAKNYEH